MRNALIGIGLILASLTLSIPVRADWASGGGQVMRDAENPWFLQNTDVVNVCVIWDQDNFHPVDADVNSLINRFQNAAAYWKREFKSSFVVSNFIEVAGQEFKISEVALVRLGSPAPSSSCMAADLRLQFGWLSTDQIDFFNSKMGGVQRYLGAAIRTHYDSVLLKGKGFIYLKPDAGPLSATSPGLVQNPWILGQGYLIDQALQHELGHVFGIPHKGMETIMAVDYLERAFHQDNADAFANEIYDEGFFAWHTTDGSMIREHCGIRSGWRRFLGIPQSHFCYSAKFEGGRVIFSSGEGRNGQGQWSERGSMTIDPKTTFMWDEAVRLYLTFDQTVITRFPDGAGRAPYFVGPLIKNNEYSGIFVQTDGVTSRRVLMTLSPSGMGFASSRFSVEIDGQWYWNLDFEY